MALAPRQAFCCCDRVLQAADAIQFDAAGHWIAAVACSDGSLLLLASSDAERNVRVLRAGLPLQRCHGAAETGATGEAGPGMVPLVRVLAMHPSAQFVLCLADATHAALQGAHLLVVPVPPSVVRSSQGAALRGPAAVRREPVSFVSFLRSSRSGAAATPPASHAPAAAAAGRSFVLPVLPALPTDRVTKVNFVPGCVPDSEIARPVAWWCDSGPLGSLVIIVCADGQLRLVDVGCGGKVVVAAALPATCGRVRAIWVVPAAASATEEDSGTTGDTRCCSDRACVLVLHCATRLWGAKLPVLCGVDAPISHAEIGGAFLHTMKHPEEMLRAEGIGDGINGASSDGDVGGVPAPCLPTPWVVTPVHWFGPALLVHALGADRAMILSGNLGFRPWRGALPFSVPYGACSLMADDGLLFVVSERATPSPDAGTAVTAGGQCLELFELMTAMTMAGEYGRLSPALAVGPPLSRKAQLLTPGGIWCRSAQALPLCVDRPMVTASVRVLTPGEGVSEFCCTVDLPALLHSLIDHDGSEDASTAANELLGRALAIVAVSHICPNAKLCAHWMAEGEQFRRSVRSLAASAVWRWPLHHVFEALTGGTPDKCQSVECQVGVQFALAVLVLGAEQKLGTAGQTAQNLSAQCATKYTQLSQTCLSACVHGCTHAPHPNVREAWSTMLQRQLCVDAFLDVDTALKLLNRASTPHFVVLLGMERDCLANALAMLIEQGTLVLPRSATDLLASSARANEYVPLLLERYRTLFDALPLESQIDLLVASPSALQQMRDWVLVLLPTMPFEVLVTLQAALRKFCLLNAVQDVELLLSLAMQAQVGMPANTAPTAATADDKHTRNAFEEMLREFPGRFRTSVLLLRAVDWELWQAAATICEAANDWSSAVRWRLVMLGHRDLHQLYARGPPPRSMCAEPRQILDLISSHAMDRGDGDSTHADQARVLAFLLAAWVRLAFPVAVLQSYMMEERRSQELVALLGCILFEAEELCAREDPTAVAAFAACSELAELLDTELLLRVISEQAERQALRFCAQMHLPTMEELRASIIR